MAAEPKKNPRVAAASPRAGEPLSLSHSFYCVFIVFLAIDIAKKCSHWSGIVILRVFSRLKICFIRYCFFRSLFRYPVMRFSIPVGIFLYFQHDSTRLRFHPCLLPACMIISFVMKGISQVNTSIQGVELYNKAVYIPPKDLFRLFYLLIQRRQSFRIQDKEPDITTSL